MNLQTNPAAITSLLDRARTSLADTTAPHAKPAEAVVTALGSTLNAA